MAIPVRPTPQLLDRYDYQRRLIGDHMPVAGELVLDVGSGHAPFPHATVLCDRYMDIGSHRAHALRMDGRPFVVGSITALPFRNRAFDFVYCSHVLEHVEDPIQACSELVRVGRRGYVETPSIMSDSLFSWATGMHRWHVESISGGLVFFEYELRKLAGIQSRIWRQCIFGVGFGPIKALHQDNLDIFNTWLVWDGDFDVDVYWLDGHVTQHRQA